MNIWEKILKSRDEGIGVLGISEFLQKLYEFDKKTKIGLDVPFNLYKKADSYRGYYEDLYIELSYDCDKYEKIQTVGELIDILEKSIGKTVEGYKGGEYLIESSSRIWFSTYGYSSGRFPVNCIKNLNECLIVTKTETWS